MKIPSYELTADLLEIINKIDVLRAYFNTLQISTSVKEKIQTVNLLKSSLYSARIEGNPLSMEDISNLGQKDKKLEIFNILDAIRYIDKNVKKGDTIDNKLILKLHGIAMNNVCAESGSFRTEVSAIYNQAGIAVYLTPPPSQISQLITDLFLYINSGREKIVPINAFIAHLVFEKIHPFIDGNGRVGRLLIPVIFKSKGWDLPLHIPFDEYLDNHREEYYYHIDSGISDPNGYLFFMLTAFLAQAENIKEKVAVELNKIEEVILPPRQEEIYLLIKDHRMVSFDFIKRRFMAVPERTLRYDLKKLKEKNFIQKIGNTNGVVYKTK